jgi:hypothetical protein
VIQALAVDPIFKSRLSVFFPNPTSSNSISIPPLYPEGILIVLILVAIVYVDDPEAVPPEVGYTSILTSSLTSKLSIAATISVSVTDTIV